MARGKAGGPLRRVVGHVGVVIAEGVAVDHELLECGHHALPRHDIAGETNAARRRCWRCRDGHPVDEVGRAAIARGQA